EILVIIIAISQEEHMLQSSSLLEAQRVAAEELAGYPDDSNLAVQEGRRQMRPNALLVFPIVKIDDARKKSVDITRLDGGIGQIDPAIEAEIILRDMQLVLRGRKRKRPVAGRFAADRLR